MEMNNQNLNQFRKDFAESVRELEEKYGVTISIGSITFDLNSFHGKMTVRNEGLSNAEWNQNCAYYGLKPQNFGETFKSGQHRFTINGIKVGATYPILVVREDGKKFGFKAEVVKSILDL